MKTLKVSLRVVSLVIFTLAFVLITAGSIKAQVTRTWVSGQGNDADPCSRSFPCRTFSAAFAVTAVNGEISVIDPGSYGTLTVTKSITIDGTGGFAGMLAAGTVGFTVNITDPADTRKTARFRGISINGTGGSLGPNTGTQGIRVLSANAVHVEDCVIDAFSFDGIQVAVSLAMTTELHVRNSVIRNCVSDGVSLSNSVVGGLVLATFDNTQLSNNGTGLNVNSRSRASLRNCTISTNTNDGITVGGTAESEAKIVECTVAYNPNGVLVNLGTARVAQSLVTGGTNGLNNVGGLLESYQNNQLRGNSNNTVGTITLVGES